MENKQTPLFKKPVIWIVVVLVLVGLSLTFIMMRKRQVSPPKEEETANNDQILPTIDPSVAIELTAREDKKEVTLTIKNIPADVTSLEYELSYFTGTGLSRGTFTPNPIVLAGTDRDLFKRDILLGTCSRNVCVYDEGVKSITLTVKFNSSRGASQFKKEFPL